MATNLELVKRAESGMWIFPSWIILIKRRIEFWTPTTQRFYYWTHWVKILQENITQPKALLSWKINQKLQRVKDCCLTSKIWHPTCKIWVLHSCDYCYIRRNMPNFWLMTWTSWNPNQSSTWTSRARWQPVTLARKNAGINTGVLELTQREVSGTIITKLKSQVSKT